MTCPALFEWFERHEGSRQGKQLQEYCMGAPPLPLLPWDYRGCDAHSSVYMRGARIFLK